jgi:hypothetical protein
VNDSLIKFKQRITGEVAAPSVEVCRIEDGWTDPPTDDAEEWCPSCGAHWPDRSVLVEKQATSVERAAVVRELKARLQTYTHQATKLDQPVIDELQYLVGWFEAGRHVQ